MPHVNQSDVKAWDHKASLHSHPVRPRTPPSTPPEATTEAAQYHAAAEVAPTQYHPTAKASPAQYQVAHDDRHIDDVDTH